MTGHEHHSEQAEGWAAIGKGSGLRQGWPGGRARAWRRKRRIANFALSLLKSLKTLNRAPSEAGVTKPAKDEGKPNSSSVYVGSGLKLTDGIGKTSSESRPFSCTGENPPYGISEGIKETSASFEARSAP
jgi:hypothetical protein